MTGAQVQLWPDDDGATFDEARVYRYHLWRRSEPLAPSVLWIMLNPSTADEYVLDPTLRRCREFSLLWGHRNFEVCNLFALRSTDPAALYAHPDPVGPSNDAVILAAASRCARVVVAWGAHGGHLDRARAVVRLLEGVPLACLGTTKDGHPRHPLYLPYSSALVPYGGRGW